MTKPTLGAPRSPITEEEREIIDARARILKKLRQDADLSERAVAKATGLNSGSLYQMERGDYRITDEKFNCLLDFYNSLKAKNNGKNSLPQVKNMSCKSNVASLLEQLEQAFAELEHENESLRAQLAQDNNQGSELKDLKRALAKLVLET